MLGKTFGREIDERKFRAGDPKSAGDGDAKITCRACDDGDLATKVEFHDWHGRRSPPEKRL